MGSGNIITNNAAPLILGTNNAERVRIDGTNGNVGIGYAPNPVGVLDVAPPVSSGGRVVTTAMPGNADIGFKLYRLANPGPPALYNPFYIRMNGADLQFMSGLQAPINGESMTAQMTITQAGNVGIGTTTPNAGNKLEVAGVIASTAGGFFSGGPITTAGMIRGNISTDLSFGTGTPGPGITERVRIAASTGNVGIGLAPDPAYKLKVLGDSLVSGNFAANSISAVSGGLFTIGPISATQLNAALTFATGTTSIVERMRIDAAGNVGIGQTNPQVKLHVVGAATITGLATTNGLNSTGSITAMNAPISTTGTGDIVSGRSFIAGSTKVADASGCYYA